MNPLRITLVLALMTLVAHPALATFHLMQIEQVIGGVDGHADVQAIQLRMRSAGQNLVQNARLYAHDATGANPVLLIDFTTSVANGLAGDRVLAATSSFSTATSPTLTPDFVLTNPIPASYLAAGSITFESDLGVVYWRLSWGGSGYTGSGTGAVDNDVDGNFNPPFAGPLPSTSEQALLFKNAASALSTNNANDYALTAGAATFTKNDRGSGTIQKVVGVSDGVPTGRVALGVPTPNPVKRAMAYSIVVPHDTRAQVRLLDVGGRVLRTLVDRSLPAGSHSFAWQTTDHDGAALPSGLYFLVLKADGATLLRRFILIQ